MWFQACCKLIFEWWKSVSHNFRWHQEFSLFWVIGSCLIIWWELRVFSPEQYHKHPNFCMPFWAFTESYSPCINCVKTTSAGYILNVPYILSQPRAFSCHLPYSRWDTVLPICVLGLSGVSALYFWCKQLAFQKWELLLIVNVWLRLSETVFSKCSTDNMSEGSKPNTNGLHESVEGYVGISGKGRGRRGHTSVWDATEPGMWHCYNVLSHICFQAVMCFRLEQIGLPKGQQWQTESIFLAKSSRLCGSWLHLCPQWTTPLGSHPIVWPPPSNLGCSSVLL